MQRKLFIAPEVSWLSFNARVLQEANDTTLTLKERIRFLGIYSNNNDEFFRIRFSVLKKIIKLKKKKNIKYYGENPQKFLDQIHHILLQQQDEFNRIWKKIIRDLKKEKVFLVDDKHLNSKQKSFVKNYFDQEISSSIIPLFIENMPHLPFFGDDNIFLGIVMQKSHLRDRRFAIIEIPKNHNRFISLPSSSGEQNIMLLEDLICFNLPSIFSQLGYTHFQAHMFKVTKDAELDIDHGISTSFIQKIEKGVKNRRKAPAIRFQYDKGMNAELLELLIQKLNLSHRDTIIPGGHIRNFRDFMDFPAILPNHHLQPPFPHPALAKSVPISDVITERDLLLHLPYHSFNSIIDLLREAAMDPDVESIKITAYRLAPNSKICNALINAVRNGKKVHVVLELRASLNEEANLEWKTKLEEEGVKVFLGFPNLKVHAKICIIKKRVGKKTKQYGFIGTGNLNEKTALSYTDHFLLTSNPEIMKDVNRIFKLLENPETEVPSNFCKTLFLSPLNMREALIARIDREIEFAKDKKPAKIIVKINSLSDERVIKKLYKAAEAGVEIQLIVRSIFCADIDQKEFAQPIKAISIVDKFLEHSRIWFFSNGGDEKIYISSADWMVRNLDYRIEVAVPIMDEAIKEELKHILKINLSDNVKARWLDLKHYNQNVVAKGKKIRSQVAIYHYLRKRSNHETSRH